MDCSHFAAHAADLGIVDEALNQNLLNDKQGMSVQNTQLTSYKADSICRLIVGDPSCSTLNSIPPLLPAG